MTGIILRTSKTSEIAVCSANDVMRIMQGGIFWMQGSVYTMDIMDIVEYVQN